MTLSLAYLRTCSAQTGYQIGPLEKVVRLGEFAADLFRHPFLGNMLVLKGGTVLNLCFGPPKRLSVDLDFNYVGDPDREIMLAERPKVEKADLEMGERQGYRVQQSRDAFAGRKFYLSYRSTLGQDDRIEVDLNYLFRLPLVEPEFRELWQPGELDRPKIRCVGLEELMIGKLLALFDRGAARDAWDVANLSAETGRIVHSRHFQKLFIAFSVILDHPLPTYTKERSQTGLTDRAVAEQLGPMLSMPAPSGKVDLIDRAWDAVGHLLDLDSHKKEYLAAIYKGELRPELLFSEGSVEYRLIADHPAIGWKLANVRSHLEKKRKTKRHPRVNLGIKE